MTFSRVVKTGAILAAVLIFSADSCDQELHRRIQFKWGGRLWTADFTKVSQSLSNITLYPPWGGKLDPEKAPFTLDIKDGAVQPVPLPPPGVSAQFALRRATEPHFVYLLDPGILTEKIVIYQQETATYVTQVPLPPRPQGIALSPDGKWLYVTHLELGPESAPRPPSPARISIMDTATRAIVQTIVLNSGIAPRKPVVSPDGRWLYVPNNGASPSILIVDTQSRAVTGAIPLPTVADRLAISPDGAILYAVPTQRFPTRLMAVDTSTREVFSNTLVSPTLRYMLVNFTGTRLYLTGEDTVVVYDTSTLTELTRIRIPGTPSVNVLTLSFDGGSLFANHEFEGILTRIDTATNQIVETVGTLRALDTSFALMVPLGPPAVQ